MEEVGNKLFTPSQLHRGKSANNPVGNFAPVVYKNYPLDEFPLKLPSFTLACTANWGDFSSFVLFKTVLVKTF